MCIRDRRHPEAVGQPLVLSPRGVRLLVLLVVGNLVMVGLLTVGLYRATMHPLVVTSPLVIPMPVTATSHPGDEAALSLPTPTPLGSGGSIAFTLRRNGNADIYVLDQANRQLVRLTHDPAEDRQPTWSPDGSKLLFVSRRRGDADLFVLDLGTDELQQLTRSEWDEYEPAWSPDGQWIAFVTQVRDQADVFVMRADGSEAVNLTNLSYADDFQPAWSLDSEWILFVSNRMMDGDRDLYRMRRDGSEVTALTDDASNNQAPSVRPDGAWR